MTKPTKDRLCTDSSSIYITCGGGPNVHHNANRNRNRNHNANVNGNTNQSEAQISPRCVTCPVSDPIHCILCYQLRASVCWRFLDGAEGAHRNWNSFCVWLASLESR